MSKSIVDTLTGLRAVQATRQEYSVKLPIDKWVQITLSLMAAQDHAQMLVSKVAGTSISAVPIKAVEVLEGIEAEIHGQIRAQVGVPAP